MVYPTNNQLLQDAYNLLCQSTNLEEVKSIVEGCGNCILSFQDQTTTRRRGRRRRRGGGNNGIDDNDDNDHNNNNNNNNTTALYKICSRSNRNKDDDLDIIKYILEQSVISNQNNEDGKGGLFTDHTTSRLCSRSTADSAGNGDSTGIRKNEINGTPLHQLVIQNRISILKHFANWTGIDDHSPRGSNDDDNNQNDKNHNNQNQNTRNKQRKRQTQKQIQKKKKSKQPKSQQKTRSRKPLLTPEDVVKYGLIFTAIQYQRFEMCQFLFHELYHPNMIQFTLDDTNKNMNTSMNHVNVNVNTDIQNNSQQRQGALAAVRVGTGTRNQNSHSHSHLHLIPLHYCTQLCYTTHYSFWERIFPYLLERGIKNDQYKYEYLDNRQYYKNATKSENEKGNVGLQCKHDHKHEYRHGHGQQQTSQELKKNRRQYNHKHKDKDKQMKCTSSRAKNKNNCQILDHSKMETSIGGLFIHDKKELYPNRNIFDIIVSQAKAQAVQTAQTAQTAHQQTTTIANDNISSGNSNSNGDISIEDAIQDVIRISYPLLENKSLLQGFIIHHCYQQLHQHQQQQHQQHHSNEDATPYIQAIIKLCPKSINTPMYTCTSIKDDENRQNQNNQQQQQQHQEKQQYQYSFLPIHIGAMYGLKWNHGMKDIVQANLTAIEEYDPIHGLFPFMLAAATDATIDTTKSISTNKTKVLFAGTDTSTKENNKSSTYSHCRCDLDTIYSLIRYRPDVYLKSKMIKREQQSTNNDSTHTCTKRKTKRNKRRRYRNKQNKKRKQKNKEQ